MTKFRGLVFLAEMCLEIKDPLETKMILVYILQIHRIAGSSLKPWDREHVEGSIIWFSFFLSFLREFPGIR